jgi:hypothetical protein
VKSSFFIMLSAGLFVSMSASAHGYWHHGHHCISDTSEIVSEVVTSKGTCAAKDALELAEKYHSYPLLREEGYLVEYWKGSFVRQVTSNLTVHHTIVNLCTGQTIVDTTITKVVTAEKVFALENPNLKETISKSYELVPLTEAEAKTALAAANTACQNF